MTIRCCLGEMNSACTAPGCYMWGIAIATCCHELFLGITEEEFHAVTWFTSWAVDTSYGPDLSYTRISPVQIKEEEGQEQGLKGVIGNMETVERAALGFMCKQIIDAGRLMRLRDPGLETRIVKYFPQGISPENSLLITKRIR